MTDENMRQTCNGVLAMAGNIQHLTEQRKRVGIAAKKLMDAGETTGKEGDEIRVPATVWLEFAAAISDLPEVLIPKAV